MPRRAGIRLKCQRCGLRNFELREVETEAGRRYLCVVCRTGMLPMKMTSKQPAREAKANRMILLEAELELRPVRIREI